MATQFTAAQVANAITRITGQYMNPKRVRGWARGDSGKPVVKRYGHDVKAPRMAHLYSADEANAIGARAIAAHNASTGQTLKWRAIGSSGKPAAPRKPRATKPASAPVTAASAPQTE